jgi:hypothetical protein
MANRDVLPELPDEMAKWTRLRPKSADNFADELAEKLVAGLQSVFKSLILLEATPGIEPG